MISAQDYDFLLRASEKNITMANLPVKILKYRKIKSGVSSHNPQRTIMITYQIQKLHKLRTSGKKEDEKILAFLRNNNIKTSWWFSLVYGHRNKLLKIQKNRRGFRKYLFWMLIILVTLGNYHIFINTYNGFQSLRWNN
jgi:hypothetical protein